MLKVTPVGPGQLGPAETIMGQSVCAHRLPDPPAQVPRAALSSARALGTQGTNSAGAGQLAPVPTGLEDWLLVGAISGEGGPPLLRPCGRGLLTDRGVLREAEQAQVSVVEEVGGEVDLSWKKTRGRWLPGSRGHLCPPRGLAHPWHRGTRWGSPRHTSSACQGHRLWGAQIQAAAT